MGAGIIGLAAAREAVRRLPRLRVLILEQEDRIASHQSGRNSGVIHSGVYYAPGSLKARLCVEGAAAMRAFCGTEEIPNRICGKVIVATRDAELPALEELSRRAAANGVPGTALIGPERLRELEPHARGVRALHVPGTGVTDFAAVAARFADQARAGGAVLRTGARVIVLRREPGGTVVGTTAGEWRTRLLLNCAGLWSDRIARLSGARPGVRILPFRGTYMTFVPERRDLVRGLIYPVPDPRLPFLDVHLTRTLGGWVEAGPTALLAGRRDGYRRWDLRAGDLYDILAYPGFWRMARRHWRAGLREWRRSLGRAAFARAAARLVPELRAADLIPGGAGVRAQAVARDGSLVDDFRFAAADGAVHVLNVPSPAATASIPIGARIVDLLTPMLA
ncbi:MAG: L-2-hydroxyglutarate oxidase [Candidatus Polarisedimenticolia bacterium]